MKRILLILGLLLLSACSSEIIEYEDEMKIDDQKITVEGETNLKNGSVINYEVKNFDDVDFFEEGQAKVKDGSFSYSLDVSDYKSGEYEIYTVFLPYQQSEELQDAYGEMGENMSGDVVYSDDVEDLKLIESRKTFKKN